MQQKLINQLRITEVEPLFIEYVQIDTQSDPTSYTTPSTEKQKNLGRRLVEQLLAMGITDAHLDQHGYVYATIPSNSEKQVPVVCFCAHMDTSPDCSGTHVKPLIHRNYQGQDLVLPDDPSIVIRAADHPDLRQQIGNDVITASGLTLLGADDKAGIAEIMSAAKLLMENPEIKHGTIRILFTPDEEIGRGVDQVDLEKLGAEVAYTLDGETAGSIEDETFSADGATLTIHGVSVHPGFAKNKLKSAIKIAAEVLSALPAERLSPETTTGREGFVHPVSIDGNVEKATVEFIIRDFDDDKLREHAAELDEIVRRVFRNHPDCRYELVVREQYRNMKRVLDRHPKIMEIGLEAIRRAGMEPKQRSIRGGTDGSRLSLMGLPCPNIFAGGHAFHGKQEWVSVQDMQLAVRTILHVANLWEEQAV